MALTLTLTFMSGMRDGEMLDIEATGSPPSVVIGRVEPCQLVLPDDPEVSRRHARLLWNGSSWILEDLGSSNGTFVGEFQSARRISEPTTLRESEIFRVGMTRIRLGTSRGAGIPLMAAASKEGSL